MDSFKSFVQGLWQSVWAGLQAVGTYLSDPWVYGSLLLLLVAAGLLVLLSRRQPSRVRAFANNNGYVEISRAALVDIIRSKSEQVDIEHKPGVSIHNRRGKLQINVKIRLLPSRRLAEVSEILQQHLREALQEGLGIRKLGNINVTVVGVRVKTGKAARKSLPLNPETARHSDTATAEPSETADVMVVNDDASTETEGKSKSEKASAVNPPASDSEAASVNPDRPETAEKDDRESSSDSAVRHN
ncbi:MAG: hypothetical protein ABQ298_01680 [Puniceicoccaceae bacterium]